MRFYNLAAAVCTVFALAAPVRAQGVFKFSDEVFDFKTIAEGTLATHEFTFTNTGNQPLVIANVQASCGCTTPEWSKTPVLPGKRGFIKAVYNSNGRPGAFNKTVTVTSNADKPSITLSIKGTVLTREQMQKTYTPEQLAKSAKLVLAAPQVALGKLEAGRTANTHFTVRNEGKQALVLNGLYSACNCVNYKAIPEPIAPGQQADVTLTYAPREMGEQAETVALYSNDITQADVKVTLRATVVKNLNESSMLREGAAAVPFK